MEQYRGASGKIYTIDPEPIAKGGEGTIHAIEDEEDIVAKVYKKEKRTKRRKEKLSQMIKYQLTEIQRRQVTWPLDVISDDGGFVGYVMPRLYSAHDFTMVCGADIMTLNLEDRLFIAYNICAAVDTVHSFGQVCGDLNPQNICVNMDTKDPAGAFIVTLVDTDSYHIVDGKMMYRCEVGQTNYLPPELQRRLYKGESLSSMPLPTYSKETDRFALAVHLFSLFMNGCHPFACALDMETAQDMEESVEIPPPSDNIRMGFSPFFHHKKGVTYPAYAPNLESLPESFRNYFTRTFVEGHDDPAARTSAREWMEAIMDILQNKYYIKCPQGHIYFIHRMECPYCAMNERHQQIQEQVVSSPEPEQQEELEEQTPSVVTAAEVVEEEPEPQEEPKPGIMSFIENHIIFILYGAIALFIVLFVLWYISS